MSVLLLASRDCVLVLVLALLTLTLPLFGQSEVAIGQPNAFPLDDAEKARLAKVVEAWRFPYDPDVRLLLIPKPSPNFKTNFDTRPKHAIRWSAEYAVACMDSGSEEYQQRAFDILDVVMSTQDTDPESDTYGLFPDFWEIPLDQMRRADGNSADFLGMALIQIRFVHGDRLPADLKARIDKAIIHAARSTVKRDVSPSYTNPAMMSLVLTLVAGAAYDDEELREFGMQKLKKVLAYTKEQGSFTEYNSPNYTVVALDALQRVKNYVRDAEALAMIDELYRLAWKHVAVRFHAPTQQWSGPNSRSYQELLSDGTQAMFKNGLVGEFASQSPVTDRDAGFQHRLVHQIPDDLKPYFTTLDEPREVVERFEKSGDPALADIIGTTWLTPDLSLGSINRGDMWDQRRNLQAYWGDSKKPGYLRTRFLKNGEDFASVNFFSQQDQGRVLGALNFSTNGGDKHLFFDAIKSGQFTAESLRLRFEFGGVGKAATFQLPESADQLVIVDAAGATFAIKSPIALLDGKPGHWESGNDGKTAWLDLVLYEGPKKDFALQEFTDSVIGFALAMTVGDASAADASSATGRLEDGRLDLTWDDLAVSIKTIPDTKDAMQRSLKAEIAAETSSD